jgi:hypothetical protein
MTQQVNEWCRVADALRTYRGAIFGQLGHIYEGMLDMNFDPTTFTRSLTQRVSWLIVITAPISHTPGVPARVILSFGHILVGTIHNSSRSELQPFKPGEGPGHEDDR